MQLGSEALYGRFAPRSVGLGIYHVLDRVAPASYVEDTLGNDALTHGDLDAAQHYAVRMPASQRRDQLLARIALARGQDTLAREYFFVADDIDAVQQRVAKLATHDLAAALALEGELRAHLIAQTTHPDAVAESYWISGNLEAQRGDRRAALESYRAAEMLAPLDVKYILALGNDALAIGDVKTARDAFAHGAAVAPGSGNVLAGLGLAHLRAGDRSAAETDLQRALRADPRAPEIATLERALH